MTKMTRIVVVATGIPEDVGGAPIRNYQILKALCGLPNSQINLFCICEERRFAAKKKQLEDDLPVKTHFIAYRPGGLFTKVYAALIAHMQPHMVAYRRLKLGRAVWEFCKHNRVDVIHIEQMDAYYCLEPYISSLQNMGIKIVLDEHNIEADILSGASRSLKFPLNIVGHTMVGSLRRLEAKAVNSVDTVLACSDVDAKWFRYVRNDEKVYVVPNGVDCEQFTPSNKKKSNKLIFIGSPGYPPNADALDFYLLHIHQKVKALVPNVRLDLIGRYSEEWLRGRTLATDKTIVPHGFVKSIEAFLDEATIGICPIRTGSGTRLKVLTYMSAGIPVVSTTKGAEGIDYTAGKNIVIADTDDDFAAAIMILLQNKKRRTVVGKNARALMEHKYDWAIIGNQLRLEYGNILGL